MPESADKQPALDQQLQTENIAFDADEMIACGGCGRTNPPNRLKCIYCAHELEVRLDDAASIRTNLRKLELWERGFNVIVRAIVGGGEHDAAKIASLLSMDAADVTAILDADTPLPLARVESEKEAAIIIDGLAALALKCSVITDDELAADKPPVRLSRIDLLEGGFALKDFNTGKVTEIAADDLALIVPGIISASRVDSVEKKQRRGDAKIIDESATAADESILDIYARHDRVGFRVRFAGFDFSCLGEDKSLLAGKNLRALIILLKDRAPNAKLVTNYSALRQALGAVWEIESRRDSKGMQRAGFGKVEFGAVASTSNLNQFTKYSRLQWHLL